MAGIDDNIAGQYDAGSRRSGRVIAVAILLRTLLALLAAVGCCSPSAAQQTTPDTGTPATSEERTPLTPEERQWLGRHGGLIRVGITVIPPQVQRGNGGYEGLAIDYLRLMERRLGCRFTLVPFITWNEVLQAARTRRTDMIFAAQETPERLNYLLFTRPYLELPNMIVVRKDRRGGDDLRKMKGWRVAASEGSAVYEYLHQEFPALVLQPVADELNGLMKVSLGEADAMVVELSRASYYIEKEGILNLRVSGDAGLLYRLRFAVRNDWPVLRTILDKGLASLTQEERHEINRRWIIVEDRSLFASRSFRISFGAALGVIALSVIGAVIWVRTLRKMVRERTAQLEAINRELRASEERYRMVFENSPVSIWEEDFSAVKTLLDGLRREGVADIDTHLERHPEVVRQCAELARIVAINRAALLLHGAAGKDELLAGLINTFTPESFDAFRMELVCLWNGATEMKIDTTVKTLAGEPRHVTVCFAVCPGHEASLSRVLVSLVDITGRKRAEEELHRLNRELRAISTCTQKLMKADDEQALLNDVCRVICDEAGYRLAWVGYAENDAAKSIRPVAWAGYESGYIEHAKLNWDGSSEHGRGPAGTVVRTGKAVFVQDFTTDPRMAPWRDSALAHGYRSGLALPLKDETGRVFGVLLIYSAEPYAVTAEEFRLMEELAGDLAFGITVLRAKSQRKRAEESLRRERTLLSRITDTSPVGIAMVNGEGLVTFANRRAEIMLGLNKNEITQRAYNAPEWRITDFDGGPFPDEQLPFRQVMATKQPVFDVRHAIEWPDGRRVYLSINGAPLQNEAGGIEAVVFAMEDITGRKQAEDALRRSEQRYRDIFDNVLDGLYLLEVTEDGRFRTLEVNPALERSTGIPREQVIGRTQEETVPPEVAAIVNAKYRRCVEAGRPIEEEVKLALPGGSRWYHSTLIPARDASGRVNRIIGISRDITERKRSEEILALLTFALDNVRDEAYLITEQARFEYVNEHSCRVLGYTREELLGSVSVADVDPDFPADRWQEHWRELRERRSLTFEGRHRSKNGSIYPVEISANYFEYGGRGYNLALARDITERKRIESELRSSEQNLALHVNQTPLGVIEWDLDFKVAKWNPAAERIFGYSRSEALGRHASMIVPAAAREQVDGIWGALLQQKGGLRSTNENVTRDGRTIYCEWYNTPLVDEEGKVIAVASLVQDVTERQKAEEGLRKLSSAIEQSPVSIVITNAEGTIEYVNPKFTEVTGYGPEEVQGRNPRILKSGTTPREEYERLWSTITAGSVWNGTFCNRKKNGELFWEKETIAPVKNAAGEITHYIAVKEDITGLRHLEDQLRQAQKMEAVGTLSGGIAHDFNNILTAIMGYANILKIKMRTDDPQRTSIDQILSASDRAAHLTQGLLAFSRKQVINPRPVDLNDIVRNVEKLLRRIIGEDIVLSTRLCPTNLICMADSVQIEQVLMNFATNARDAMPDGGSLVISTQEVDLGADFVALHGFGKPGRHALIAVSDTGQGMDEETRAKIFDPFFTTKEPGKGTGLGLAIVYGIIKQHSGNINVYSEPGKGTTFKVYLPLIVTTAGKTEAEEAAAPRGGRETILLAEDDRQVRDLTAMILRDYGYTVIEALDGEDAVEQFKLHDREIDLLLLDVIMPRKSGKEACDEIHALRPDAAALFISGYTADMLDRKGISGEGIPCISKPVSPFELLRKVREILDGKQRAV